MLILVHSNYFSFLFYHIFYSLFFRKGETSLHYAVQSNHLECVQVLLNFLANPTIQNSSYVHLFYILFKYLFL